MALGFWHILDRASCSHAPSGRVACVLHKACITARSYGPTTKVCSALSSRTGNQAEYRRLSVCLGSQKSIPAAVLFYLREFDVVGLLLISLGFCLFLLPFNIYSLQPNGWQSPLVISTIVIGPVLIGAFVFWEVRFASPRFLPLQFLSNRTLLGACMTSAALFFSYTCWVSYFASFVMVVNDVTLQSATYISNIYGFGGTFFQLFLGWFLRKVCRFRAITLYFAIPLHMLGLGLMIHFRQPGQHIGYIVMCQVLISLAGCIVTLNTTIAAMACKWPYSYHMAINCC